MTSFAYNLAGRLAWKEYPNGATAAYVYDPNSVLLSVIHRDATGNVLVDYRYEYDNVGNRTAMTSRGQTTQFAYDALYQLLSVTYPTGETIQYSDDVDGQSSNHDDACRRNPLHL